MKGNVQVALGHARDFGFDDEIVLLLVDIDIGSPAPLEVKPFAALGKDFAHQSVDLPLDLHNPGDRLNPFDHRLLPVFLVDEVRTPIVIDGIKAPHWTIPIFNS
jgi:hypothetical protein